MKTFNLINIFLLALFFSSTSSANEILKVCNGCSSSSSFYWTAKATVQPGMTKVKVLNYDAFLNEPNAVTLSQQIGDLINAYQDLNLQLNEAFNTSFEDLLEEIKLEKEQPDEELEEENEPQ